MLLTSLPRQQLCLDLCVLAPKDRLPQGPAWAESPGSTDQAPGHLCGTTSPVSSADPVALPPSCSSCSTQMPFLLLVPGGHPGAPGANQSKGNFHSNVRDSEERRGQVKVKVAQSCLTLFYPVDCSLPGSSVHEFLRQEYWSGLPFPSPGDLPNQGIKPMSPALQVDSLPSEGRTP